MRKHRFLGFLHIGLCLIVWFGCGNDDDDKDTITSKDGVPMVLIPAGEFEMGDHFNDGVAWERPVHTVSLDAFYMDMYEVTNTRYATFLNEMGRHHGDSGQEWGGLGDIELVGGQYRPKVGFEEHPMTEVNWYAAATYAQWAGKRLPTEAEWEKAARGGLVGKRYPWGDEAPDEGQQYRANYNQGARIADGYRDTAPVGSFPPNGYGLYDMAGNVWEWCMDEFDDGFYARSPRENPVAGGATLFVNDDFTNVNVPRVVRGGGLLNSNPYRIRVAHRNVAYTPERFNYFIGFRCARSVAL